MTKEMRFTESNVDEIVRVMRLVDEGAHVRPDYSGRGMYGAECVGFVAADAFLVLAAVVDVMTAEGVPALDVYAEMCTDDMGLSAIAYFPRVPSELPDSE